MKTKATKTKYGRNTMLDSGQKVTKRVLVATPSGTGSVRMEWALARYGQIIPMNWSMVQFTQFMNSFVPYRYAVADAQNIIVQEAVREGYEWLILIEDDNVLPPDAFMRWNKYMQEGKVPVVSGLYFSKSQPPEPMIFRGRGTSVYWKWKFGDKVWCDGVPTGSLLINGRLLKAMYEESAEYLIGNLCVRRVFETPQRIWMSQEGNFNSLVGTSDLEWCTRIMRDGFFKKSGWSKYQKMKYPFLVDTGIFVKHIDRETGEQFPDANYLK